MFHNYLITAFRSIVRHKLFSFIDIAGLAVGLTAAILIGLFVQQSCLLTPGCRGASGSTASRF